jgi:uncharacterized protein YecT (DUF1311 family)
MRIPLSLLFAISFVGAATAAERTHKDYGQLYGDCLRKAGPTNNFIVISCAQDVSTQAKAEINALYRKLHARLHKKSPEDAAKLEKSQKAWVEYRNGYCDLAGEYVGTPMYEYCPMQLNIERVEQLRELSEE